MKERREFGRCGKGRENSGEKEKRRGGAGKKRVGRERKKNRR